MGEMHTQAYGFEHLVPRVLFGEDKELFEGEKDVTGP